jgi:hypothetical protein
MRTWPGKSWRNLRGADRRRRKVLASMLGAACCLMSWPSPAGEPARVLVVAPPESRLERLLAAEIGNLGLVALVRPRQADAATMPFVEALASAGAAAAVRVADAGDTLEIWIAERSTGRAVLRETVPGLGDSSAEDVAVLRASELLRANLIEVELPKPAPPAPEVVPPKAPPKRPARWVAAAGPMLLVGQPSFATQPGIIAGLGFEPRSSYGVDLWFAWAATDSVQSTVGSARISPRHFGLGAIRIFTAPWTKWRLALGGSAAAQWLHVVGRAQPGYAAGSDHHVAAALLGRGQIAYAPLPRLRFALDLHAGATWQRTRIRLAGEDVATWGRGLALACLRAEVLW